MSLLILSKYTKGSSALNTELVAIHASNNMATIYWVPSYLGPHIPDHDNIAMSRTDKIFLFKELT